MTSPSFSSSQPNGAFSMIVSIALPNCPITIRPFRSAMRGN